MQFKTISSLEKRDSSDVLIIPFWKGKKFPEPVSELSRLKTKVQPPIHAKDFTAKEGECIWLYGDDVAEPRLLLLGLGVEEKITSEKLRRAFGACVKACQQRKAVKLTTLFPVSDYISQETAAKAIAEGLISANYSFDAFKNETAKDSISHIEEVSFIGSDAIPVLDAVHTVQKVMKGVYLARDLTNGNADDVTPECLAEYARKIVKKHPRLKVEVHDEAWIKKQGMGLFLAVARGSSNPPKFIVMKWRGNPASSDHTVIIGKGVTFDTGGLHLKPMGSIETQKSDMGGAAVALGTIQAIADLELPINVTVVIAACENVIGSKAYKPGDVYKSYLGKTVEILSTDAEGRLTLADALAWTEEELKPSRIIDLATLTAAMIIALGSEAAGLMSNSESLAEELFQAGQRTHERCWRLPLYEEYRDSLKSDIADMKNWAGRDAGLIVSATFLQEFVGKTPWAHFDIAGVCFVKEAKRYLPKYATGFGVRLLIDFFEHMSDKARK
jgi:leucyl aminopeptidase